MIGNVVSIMWLLFMTIALVMMSVMAYTSIKTDFGCLRDVKELKSLRKLVKEQSETIENRERRIIELEQELENQYGVGYDEHWQDINTHGSRRCAYRRHVTTEESDKCEEAHHNLDDQKHGGSIFVYS